MTRPDMSAGQNAPIQTPIQTPTQTPAQTPIQTLPVYRATAFRVTDGANLGDVLGDADELMLDDIYELAEGARPGHLTISDPGTGPGADPGNGPFVITEDSELGGGGHLLHLDSCLTLMPPDGTTVEALILAEVSRRDHILEQVLLLPLAPLAPHQPYRLVGIDRAGAAARFAEVACVSFSRGTHITLADGRQCLIEDLRVGDSLLTRDDGAQTIRWIGRSTQRAVGEFAPIVITKGTLNNENDLIVSPNHRLFIYQRQDELQAGRAEILVKARHLVNATSVFRQDGGFVDYFQLLFDHHQIIYAEGIAAESLLLDRRTSPALPKAVTEKLRQGFSHPRADLDFEVEQRLLTGDDAAERLRRASAGWPDLRTTG